MAFWVGGASSGVTPTATPGFRSLMAYWMGGASATSAVPTPAIPGGAGGGTSSWEVRGKWAEYTWKKQREYDELFAKLLAKERELETVQARLVLSATDREVTAARRKLRTLKAALSKLRARLARIQLELEEEPMMIAFLLH